jgi:hypothetical protein
MTGASVSETFGKTEVVVKTRAWVPGASGINEEPIDWIVSASVPV